MSDNPFDDIKKTQTPIPNIEGLVWVTQLIKYDLRGKATVIRSFTTQARDSDVKKFISPKKVEEPKGINFNTDKKDNVEKTSLF